MHHSPGTPVMFASQLVGHPGTYLVLAGKIGGHRLLSQAEMSRSCDRSFPSAIANRGANFSDCSTQNSVSPLELSD